MTNGVISEAVIPAQETPAPTEFPGLHTDFGLP